MRGIIKSLKVEKRFGWLRDADGADTFFHFDDVDPADLPRLQLGAAVTYELGSFKGRSKAILVKPLTKSVRDLLAGGGL
jgi:cold shock CspA family protein